tara:strand:+ start:856 stop:1551 length:696 start_codon:yes stop_codon:yes gene_type:complete
MLIGISQPTFLPWIGYFAFLDKIQKLIFLDDVQFEKRSWQQRNYINLNNEKLLLTIPVKSKGKFNQKISDVKILSDKNLDLIKKKIYHAYNKSAYFKNYYYDICDIFDKKHEFLIKLNLELIRYFAKSLDIKIKFDFSSNYSLDLKKENLIFELCKLNNCDKYLTTKGSINYLESFKVIPNTNIPINYFEYEDVEYKQIGKKFIPKLSIIDLLFNEGNNSINIVREGFKLI